MKVITEEFFGSFEELDNEIEEAVREAVVALYRYVLYGNVQTSLACFQASNMEYPLKR